MSTIPSAENERSRFAILVDIEFNIKRLESLINRTPSGPNRNDLTEANIHLQQAVANLKQ